MSYDLFISYSRRDNEQGRITQLVERIKTGFAPFAKRELVPFFDQQEIAGMQDWRQRILQGLRESRLLLGCLSPSYLKSEYCEWEFVEYLKYEIGHLHGFNGVAPVYFVEVPGWDNKDFEQQCAAWVAELRKRQHFDLRPWYEQGEEALREAAVQERMGKLNRHIVQTITRGERAEKSLGNVDAHNPHFIGRTANLRMLRENFVTPGHIGVVTAVNGVGGLGKTALAIEYAHAFADEYGGGRWQVRCAGKDDLRLALAELATPIGFEFTEDEKRNADLQFERVRRELMKLADTREPHRCLLLLDNVDRPGLLDPAQVARFNGGDWLHVLATTRLGENELHGAHRDRSFLAIDELPPDDALALIESYQPDGRFGSEAERHAAREIVRLLGCFTLAVESAAVYLGQFANDVTCAAFLARLKKEGLEGLDTAAIQSSEGVLHGEKRLSATLQPTLERLGPAEKLALEFAALLPPDQVPLPWLRALVAKTFPEMERDAEPGYPDPWKNVTRRLMSLRLLQATDDVDDDGQPRVVRVHRLVGELVSRGTFSVDTRSDLVATYLKARCNELESIWHLHQWEIPPLVAFAQDLVARRASIAPQFVRSLCQWLTAFDCGRYSEAILRATLAQIQEDPKGNHPDLAVTLSNLGWALRETGRYAEAETHLRRALEVDESAPSENEHAVAIRCDQLAGCLHEQGKLSEAEVFCRRALEWKEKSLDADHRSTLISVNNLAGLLFEKGDIAGAESLYRRALETSKRIAGSEHPDTLAVAGNLAHVVLEKGDIAAAEPLCLQTLEAFERILGPEHPHIVSVLAMQGSLLRKKGDIAGAETIWRRVLEIRERTLGRGHPDTLISLNNLAFVLESKGNLAAAESLFRRAFEDQQRVLGSQHPYTLINESNLAEILTKKGDLAAAEPLYRHVLEVRQCILGPEHPDTLNSLTFLAELLEKSGRVQEAVPLRQRFLESQELKLGPEHADTLRSWNNHCVALRRQGQADLADPIVRRVAATTAKVIGDNHPLTINRRANLALTLIMLGKLEEARQIVAANWRLNAAPHANTTPRIAFLRHLIALLESQPHAPFLGQLKTLLTGPELPVASDVVVPWDIAYLIESLKRKIGDHDAECLAALVAAINERAKLPVLDSFPEWCDQAPVSLETPWPD